MSFLLEYENALFLELFHEDALVVYGSGLCPERLTRQLIRLYCDVSQLVIVVNADADESQWLAAAAVADGAQLEPKILTADRTQTDRKQLYSDGGVFFVTSRILVVDLLRGTLRPDAITGMIVLHAEQLMEFCQEAFVLRLFREVNSSGFIKAISDKPQSLARGFGIERILKSLFLKRLQLLPRFHTSVTELMSQTAPEVIEIRVALTDDMRKCQSALLALIKACTQELSRSTPALDPEDLTVENALTRGFDGLLKSSTDPIWHEMSRRSRQLVADIKSLRAFVQALTQYDAYTFYHLVNNASVNEKSFGNNCAWLFLPDADRLLQSAKSRIQQNGEVPPKWLACKDLLQEIDENQCNKHFHKVLIIVHDAATQSQLNSFLRNGNIGCQAKQSVATAKIDKKQTVTLTQMMKSNDEDDNNDDCDESSNKASKSSSLSSTNIDDSKQDLLQKFASIREFSKTKSHLQLCICLRDITNTDRTLPELLNEFKPNYVLLFDPDITAVRQLEVYQLLNTSQQLRIYFLMYEGSVEEQRYLTNLRKEKEAFEYLIHERSIAVITDEPVVQGDLAPHPVVSSRNAQLVQQQQQQQVIVDMREFRCPLPCILHRHGMQILPATITIGDYILSPDICVERKSVSDLIGSLNSGRLYNQAQNMTRNYQHSVLLIEFSADKGGFALFQGKASISSEINSSDIISKLTLLTLHFPQLRIMWSQSPYATAELFLELKQNKEQPSLDAIPNSDAGIDDDDGGDPAVMRARDMLLRLPSVTHKNFRSIISIVNCLQELGNLTQQQIYKCISHHDHAMQLYQFLHSDLSAAAAADVSDGKKRKAKPNMHLAKKLKNKSNNK